MAEETDNGQNDTSTADTSQSEGTLLTSPPAEDTPVETGTEASGEGAGDKAATTEETEASDKTDADAADVVPEGDYEFKMPEGMEVDKALANRAQGVFKEMGLTQGQADKLTSMIAEQRVDDSQSGQAAYQKQIDGWVNDIKSDPDMGGDNFAKNAGVAAKAVDKFGSSELKEFFNSTGAGNHPELFRFAMNVGKTISEDQPGSGDNANQADATDRMYGDTTPKSF